MPGMGKRVRKTANEYDVIPKARRLYCYMQRAGASRKAKKLTTRRERRQGKREAREEL